MQFDNVVTTLDAAADETAFRQELFAHTFSTNETAQHLVKVTAVLSGSGVVGTWFDLDYITFTSSKYVSRFPSIIVIPREKMLTCAPLV